MPPATEGGPLSLKCKVIFFSARLSRMVNPILPAGASHQPTFCRARSTANTNVQHSNPAALLEWSDFFAFRRPSDRITLVSAHP